MQVKFLSLVFFTFLWFKASVILPAKRQTIIPQKTVLIIPFGDANTIGRYIGENVERSLTMHAALALKSCIESVSPAVSVLLSRKIGEVVPFLQTAHFANCLNVNLVVSLHFYQETETRPNLYIYRYKDSSYFIKPINTLTLYPYYQAYLFNQEKTKYCAEKIFSALSQDAYQKFFTVHTPLGFPAKPLLGIVPVAIMLEIGLKDETDWSLYTEPLCNAIVEILKDI